MKPEFHQNIASLSNVLGKNQNIEFNQNINTVLHSDINLV